MAPPTKATSNPKKKKPTKHVSIKEQARVKYKKRLQEFKVWDPVALIGRRLMDRPESMTQG
jgi:hypothetical protein